MKYSEGLRVCVLVVAGLAILNFGVRLRGQTLATRAPSSDLRLVSPEAVPFCGTFYLLSAQLDQGSPPYPYDPYGGSLPVYLLDGFPTLITNLETSHLEGILTLTNDAARWGPWAGKIITGNENNGRIYTIDPGGVVTEFDTTVMIPSGIYPEDFDLVPANQDLYACDQAAIAGIYKLSRSFLTNFTGDLIITDGGEFGSPPGKLYFLHWNSATTNFVLTRVLFTRPDGSNGEFEHVTFAPIILPTTP